MSQTTIADQHELTPPPVPQAASLPPVRLSTRAFPQQLRKSLPTVLVMVVLAGLALWGHETDWTLPKFSSLWSHDNDPADNWCKDHNVAESECIECHPNLVPRDQDYGWCAEHGIAPCPLHHPDVAQLKQVPTITSGQLHQAARALALRARPENNSRCKLHERRIQFASIGAIQKVGVDVGIVKEQPMIEAVVANGEVVYNQDHWAHLTSRVTGTVWRVEKQIGDPVRKGDLLALIDSAEISRTKAEFLQAIAQLRLKQSTLERLQPLASNNTIPGRQLREAEAALQESQIRLLGAQQALVNLGLVVRAEEFTEASTEEIADKIRFLGLPEDTIATLDKQTATSNLFPLRSPLDGIVIARDLVPGEVVETGKPVFGVADVNQMWLLLDVRQEDTPYLAMGQPVLFQSSGGKNEPVIKGSLDWISTAADDQSRTVKVRVNLPNHDGRLRANTYGMGRIVLRDEKQAMVIPTEALHWDGDCQVVFVRDKNFFQPDAPKFFHIRKVRVGIKAGEVVEIIAGLLPGEVIASKNSQFLEAQLLKSNLGAGCCEASAPKK